MLFILYRCDWYNTHVDSIYVQSIFFSTDSSVQEYGWAIDYEFNDGGKSFISYGLVCKSLMVKWLEQASQ